MLMGALLIHLTGGRIETHFHVFGSLAFLAFYRDWRVLIPATIVVALDHMLRGMFWPQSVYGVLVASEWRWLEHAAGSSSKICSWWWRACAASRRCGRPRNAPPRSSTKSGRARKRRLDARNANARNDAILDVALDCVVLVDAAGTHRVSSIPRPKRRSATARTRRLAATSPTCWCRPRNATRIAPRWIITCRRRQRDAESPRRVIALRKGGAEFPVEVAIAPISTAGVPLFAGYMRDITERKRAEEELARQTRDLQDAHDTERRNAAQLAALVEELRMTQRQAEAATRAKSEFLASMSHELRTPLNAIILYSELLQEEAKDHETTARFPICSASSSSGKHLLDLINGILDLSKIEAGKMALELEHFDVKAMIDEARRHRRPLVAEEPQHLHRALRATTSARCTATSRRRARSSSTC